MGKEFELKDGQQAAHAHSGEWLQPTVNPFGHGCCDCGLFHQVEWRIVTKELGDEVTHSRDDYELTIQLRFVRDDAETARLREHRKPCRDVPVTLEEAIDVIEDFIQG